MTYSSDRGIRAAEGGEVSAQNDEKGKSSRKVEDKMGKKTEKRHGRAEAT